MCAPSHIAASDMYYTKIYKKDFLNEENLFFNFNRLNFVYRCYNTRQFTRNICLWFTSFDNDKMRSDKKTDFQRFFIFPPHGPRNTNAICQMEISQKSLQTFLRNSNRPSFKLSWHLWLKFYIYLFELD